MGFWKELVRFFSLGKPPSDAEPSYVLREYGRRTARVDTYEDPAAGPIMMLSQRLGLNTCLRGDEIHLGTVQRADPLPNGEMHIIDRLGRVRRDEVVLKDGRRLRPLENASLEQIEVLDIDTGELLIMWRFPYVQESAESKKQDRP